ncbi:MAG: DNA polymerase III subunit delta [Bacilli bacterium]|nr:DNA polymerase III subunit delta [Bacilli bacterium]
MIYVYYSELQKSFLKREARKIMKSSLGEPNDFNYVRVDAKEVTVQEIVNHCLEVPMLENKKVVVVEDAFFVASSKSKEKINKDNDYDVLLKYLAHPVEETDLVLLVYADKLDARNKVFKALTEAGARFAGFAPLKEGEWLRYTEALVEKSGLQFAGSAIRELARRTINDRDRLINEIEKLGLYKKDISINDVVTLVSEPLEDRAFTLTNALLAGKTDDALFIYHDLITKSMDPSALLTMIANQFRFMYIANYLNRHDQGLGEIAQQLNAKEFRVKMALVNAKAVKQVGIAKILDDIYIVDKQIKSGRVDRFVAFSLFITNFARNYLL